VTLTVRPLVSTIKWLFESTEHNRDMPITRLTAAASWTLFLNHAHVRGDADHDQVPTTVSLPAVAAHRAGPMHRRLRSATRPPSWTASAAAGARQRTALYQERPTLKKGGLVSIYTAVRQGF